MSPLPVGTVTFLFTDIEGSTGRWERYPDAMRPALARHDAILRNTIEAHDGYVVKPTGDGFHAVFARATDAVAAAIEAQLALHAEAWGEVGQIKVRMALHTGEAEERDNDYFGPPLNRCARLLSCGYGEQVLLSMATAELVRDALPEGASLKDLGTHRLRDLIRPERVFQLLHPVLPTEFPPLKSLDAFPNNLPFQLTSFVGREKEMAEVKRLLKTERLLTLTGTGGCGKTRLALQLGADLLGEYADGVWFVELAPITDHSLVAQEVARELGVQEEPKRAMMETLTDYLCPKRLLLLLDNCEHLIEECARLAEVLLRACPKLQILATSREGLRVAGEVVWRVPSLSVPEPMRLLSIERLTQYEAVELFIERAVAANPNFAVTNSNAPAVAQVCWRLDGIPLAIELAAARVKVLSVEQIAKRLDDRFRLLTGGSRTALPRQQTLRALIDWSYKLLSEKELWVFQRLSVFAGGFGLEAAEMVCAGEMVEDWDVLDLLTELVSKSLVIAEEQFGEVRYLLLETLRAYGWERLTEGGDAEAVCRCHAEFFVTFAEEAEPQLTGPEQEVWLERLEAELENLRVALAWALENEPEAGLQLAKALREFWEVRGYWTEGRKWFERALSKSRNAKPTLRAEALESAGRLAREQGDYEQAKALFEKSLELNRQLGNKCGIANVFNSMGYAAQLQGDLARASAFYEESLATFRELNDKRNIAASLFGLGNIAYHTQGGLARARTLYEESLAIFRELRDKSCIAPLIASLGTVARVQGDYGRARALYEESLAMGRDLSDKSGIASSLLGLGTVAHIQGDYGNAQSLFEDSLAIFRELSYKLGIASSLRGLGDIAQAQGDYTQAYTFYEQSLVIWRELNYKLGIASSLHGLGAVAQAQGDYGTAHTLLEESLAMGRELSDKPSIASSLQSLGLVAHNQGDYGMAHVFYEESLTIFLELNDKRGIAACMEGFARVAIAQGQAERAARIFGVAEALREIIGAPLLPNARPEHDRQVAAVRVALGEEAFAAAWAEGRAMSMEQATAYALVHVGRSS